MQAETLLEFPCDFPVKIMGVAQDGFVSAMLALVLEHAPDFDAATMQTRVSGKGNYLAITCTIRATSKGQLDGLYRALTAHPDVKMAL